MAATQGAARLSVGLTPGVAVHKVNSAKGGREGPLRGVVRAKVLSLPVDYLLTNGQKGVNPAYTLPPGLAKQPTCQRQLIIIQLG